jgi:putative acetyltransferase
MSRAASCSNEVYARSVSFSFLSPVKLINFAAPCSNGVFLVRACCSDSEVKCESSATHRMLYRPAGVFFTTPYEDFLIRSWRPDDRDMAAGLIREVLAEYGLGWDADDADADAVFVEDFYATDRSEFWVVESCKDNRIVGTAAYRPAGRSPAVIAELRKMYICKEARGRGLGSFLLYALEERARQIGFIFSFVETASVLVEAVNLYKREGYRPISDVETARCDMALIKALDKRTSSRGPTGTGRSVHDEFVAVVDAGGYIMFEVRRSKARRRRLLYKAIAVLVLSADEARAFAQVRSRSKHDFPGALDLFVAGAVGRGETSLEAAYRELSEELGLSGEHFKWSPLWNGRHIVDTGTGDRCSFEGFVATAKFCASDTDVRFLDGEVEEGRFMTRAEVDEADIPSPVWAFLQNLESTGSLPGRDTIF